ncbi:putative membrane protein [Pseudoclavibacter chungangensis]|nr:SRPBCC family protein [Pseudoclavibacter chungangensis]NYJ68511.1 putative membrane protein [Pseudoclavibacter chungangensis]
MTHVSESIDIGVPAETIYALFDDTQALPSLVSFVKSVEPAGDNLTHWVVEVAGVKREFDAKRVVAEAPVRSRWESATPGVDFSIEARTDATGPTSTRFSLDAEFDAGRAERLGLAKAVAGKLVSSELKKVKQQLEASHGA